ncbi:MAG: helix-turn-helix transcriptional regulator [Alphaproteobacteria bacterium]|nr:helix-turn-helix transcriptional regulator [Alphaproteobacteria bacterium]
MTKKRKTKGTPDSVDVHVGQRLRIRRSLLGLSQEKLAESIGLTFQQIQKYERGMNRISAGRLYQFSKILSIPISYFYDNIQNISSKELTHGLSDSEQEEFNNEDIMQSKETLDMIRMYYSIKDPEMRKDIFKFIKSMAERSK